MPKKKKSKGPKHTPEGNGEISLLTKIARLLEILVQLNLRSMGTERSQKDMVLTLDSAGCGHSEIATLLGINPNSVGPTLSRAKSKRK